MPVFLDTNILLYAISNAVQDMDKRDRASALLDRDDCILSVQVLQEFYFQATRASRSDPLPHEIAVGFIQSWLRFQVQDNTVAILQSALDIKASHGFSYWDSAILAAAQVAGCTELYTEDLMHGRKIGGVRIINPFR